MKLGYWRKGDHALHTHILDPIGRPGCHVSVMRPAELVEFEGGLQHVDCRRCLVMERRRTRLRMNTIEYRLRGRAGVQVDMEELR